VINQDVVAGEHLLYLLQQNEGLVAFHRAPSEPMEIFNVKFELIGNPNSYAYTYERRGFEVPWMSFVG
jgi:hypothetical protein